MGNMELTHRKISLKDFIYGFFFLFCWAHGTVECLKLAETGLVRSTTPYDLTIEMAVIVWKIGIHWFSTE
jgi:hypothetical protein